MERLEIQYVPKELSISRSPQIAGVAVVGRNNPIHHYIGGTTELSLELDFHCEEEHRQDVIGKCKWLESLAYSDGFSHPPEIVHLTFGKVFRSYETWIVKDVKYKLSLFQGDHNFLPKQANVQLTLALDTRKNLRIEDVQWR